MNRQNECLVHYGVRGMKWGVLKSRASTSSSKKRSEKDEYLKSMSDDDLRRRLNRIQMEKQYKKVTTSDVDKGKRIASSALKVTAKFIGKSIAVAGVYGGAKYFASKYNLSDIGTEKLARAMEIVKVIVS